MRKCQVVVLVEENFNIGKSKSKTFDEKTDVKPHLKT
jgi:hypothetical protein